MPDEPLTITAAAPRIRTGELTPSDLLEQCLRRVDIYEPHVKAWVYLDRERARRDAQKLTDDVKGGNYRGPLHGIPIGIKDIIDVFDMPTGCGSKLWANSYARRDATVVERLRQAGAIILGKTVTTPYAFTDPPVTRNPWNLNRTPGGSSSGSAAAVACGMCLGALGTQTGGSLTRPASYCGIYSMKPTWGLVSVNGVLPLAPSLDHVGVMANCVRDLAILFQTITGVAAEGKFYLGCGSMPVDCVAPATDISLDKHDFTPLGGLFLEGTQEVIAAYDETVSTLIGGELLHEACYRMPSEFSDVHRHHRTIMAVESATYHRERFSARPEEYPANIAQLIRDGEQCLAIDYRRAEVYRDSLQEITRRLLAGSFFVTPATTDLPPNLDTTGDPRFNSPWSFLHTPTISMPTRFTPDGLPMAIQLVGAFMLDEDLIGAAAWAERCLNFPRRLPPVPDTSGNP